MTQSEEARGSMVMIACRFSKTTLRLRGKRSLVSKLAVPQRSVVVSALQAEAQSSSYTAPAAACSRSSEDCLQATSVLQTAMAARKKTFRATSTSTTVPHASTICARSAPLSRLVCCASTTRA